MKTIKIIDLFNKIANGEEVPKEISFDGHSCRYDEECSDYFSDDKFIFADTYFLFKAIFKDGKNHLNDEVEILDEEDEFEDIKEIGSDDTIGLDVCESFEFLEEKINQLIKNQKKIIERLKDE